MYRTIGSPLLIVATMLVFQHASVTRAEELEIGAKAPEFKAQGIDGREYTLNNTQNAKATVIAFTCNQCPVAQAYEERFASFQKKYADRGVQFIAINVNASENLDAMKERAKKEKLNYAYAYDESGDSARAFGARVTPHLFVIDSKGLIAYQGSFDDKQSEPTTPYVENAVNALLAGKQPDVTTTKAFGCGIKPKKN